MKKRILKIAAFVFAIALIVGVCVFANGLVGNPISKAIATNTAEKHLEENYADKDFEIERVFYSFKDGYYHAFIYSPSSIDSDFTMVERVRAADEAAKAYYAEQDAEKLKEIEENQ